MKSIIISILISFVFPIIGGWEVDPACPECKYPFNVSLQTDRYYILSELQPDLWANEGGLWQGHFCQGTLVDENWVLTTVNCVDVSENIFTDSTYVHPSDIWVEIGLHHIESIYTPMADSISVENIYIHPDYDSNDPGYYNYALLELSESTDYEPIQLISDSTYAQIGDSVTVMGWGGHTNWCYGEWCMDHFLRENSSTIGECNQLWSLHETILCLAEWDLDDYEDWTLQDILEPGFPGGACDGDWGASLIALNNNNEYELLGNFVSGCVMSVWNQNRFSRISTVTDWIYSYTGYPCEDGAFVNVSIVFDDNPDETSWELWYRGQSPDGGYLYLADSGNDSDDHICISDEGVYEFIIYDEGGDGLSQYPWGSYNVTLDTGGWGTPDEEIVANGGFFDSLEATLFAWPDSDGDLIINSLDIEPNNEFICSDNDQDGCDDCSSGFFDLENDCSYDLGDVNLDGAINVVDVVALVEYVLNGEYNNSADINIDGLVDVIDIVVLVDWILNP